MRGLGETRGGCKEAVKEGKMRDYKIRGHKIRRWREGKKEGTRKWALRWKEGKMQDHKIQQMEVG